MSGRAAFRALAVLAVVELAAFGAFSTRLGFYHDDWVLLDQLQGAGGFWAGCKALSWLATRPLDIPLFSALFSLGGLHPFPYHLVRMALDLAAGWLFYLVLERLTRRPAAALSAAALALLVPNRDVVHVWVGAMGAGAATTAVFASLLLRLRHEDEKRPALLWASLALYLSSVLLYESFAFFPLLLAVELGPLALWPYGAALAAGLLWERVGAAALAAAPNTKAAGFSLAHALKVAGAGFECVSNRVVHMSALSLQSLAKEAPGLLALCALAALGAARLLSMAAPPEAKAPPWRRLSALFAAAFAAAYLPYAATAAYTPQVFGIMSRTNAGGAWAAGLLFAFALEGLAARPRARLGALAALVFCFTAADWRRTLSWGAAWDAQKGIVGRLAARSSQLPSGATVLLDGAPSEIDHAVVFDASWDFEGALRALGGRRDLQGNLLRLQKTPLAGEAFVYDAGKDTLVRYDKISSYGAGARPPSSTRP